MTRDEIVQVIAEITASLKGPLPNPERTMLHLDRQDMRCRLAAMDAVLNAASRPAEATGGNG